MSEHYAGPGAQAHACGPLSASPAPFPCRRLAFAIFPYHADGAADDDPYEVLGVSPGASVDEIRSSYQRLARVHHPDRQASSGGGGDDAAAAFRRVQRAYDALREPDARRRHDAEARAAAMAGAAAAARVFEVDLSDMRFEVEEGEEEEGDGDGDGGEHSDCDGGDGTQGSGCGVWRYDCRCGDEFALLEAQLADAVPCRSCSLVLRVVNRSSSSTLGATAPT